MVKPKKADSNQCYANKNSKFHFKRPSFGRKRSYHNYYHERERYFMDRYHFSRQQAIIQSKESAPIEGTEEYMANKIKQTSAIIMRQILSPNEPIISTVSSAEVHKKVTDSKLIENNGTQLKSSVEKQNDNSNAIKKTIRSEFNIKEIHKKIMNHIVNLNMGRRKNFINADSTGLDTAIQEIQKQKRLEISRLLRHMCSSESCDSKDSGELIDSIIPDLGIRLEELPISVIEELRMTLNFDFDEDSSVNDVSTIMLTPSDTNTDIDVDIDDQFEIKEEIDRIEHDSIEITSDDILDESNPDVSINISIKDECDVDRSEPKFDTETDSVFSQETVVCSDTTGDNTNTVLRHNAYLLEQPGRKDAACQADNRSDVPLSTTEEYVKNCLREFTTKYGCDVTNLKDVSQKMEFINECISDLARFRDSLFKAYCMDIEANTPKSLSKETNVCVGNSTRKTPEDKRIIKKRKVMNYDKDIAVKGESLDVEQILKFPPVTKKVSVIQRVNNELVIATEAGQVICISLQTGDFVYTFEITTVPITSLLFDKGCNDFVYMYVGSCDMALKIYDFHNRSLIKAYRIDDRISCMDSMWGYVFLGCQEGSLMRFSIEKRKIELNEKNSGSSTMVIKAAWEGPRRVLLIGYKQAPVYMRCAMTGLYLRNFSNEAISPTVYSLLLDNNFLYCGTASNSILVFSFHDGKKVNKISGADYKGISCMKLYKHHLFAGCYNGTVCVYNLKTKTHIAALKGPGGGILSMEVLNNQIIVGTLKKQFDSIPIPPEIFSLSSANSYDS